MSEFVASNGVTVWRNTSSGRLRFTGDPVDLDDLRAKLSGDHIGFSPSAELAILEFVEHEANHKPWHDAIAGEVWALTLEGHTTAWTMDHSGVFGDPDSTLDPNSAMITAGRRIWPEES